MWEDTEIQGLLQVHPTLESPHAFQPRSSLKPLLLCFYGGFIHDWWNHWPLVLDSISSPSPLSRVGVEYGRWEWKFQSSNHRVGVPWQSAPSSDAFWKSLINTTRNIVITPITENFKGFWSSVPKMGMKTKYALLQITIPQYIIVDTSSHIKTNSWSPGLGCEVADISSYCSGLVKKLGVAKGADWT